MFKVYDFLCDQCGHKEIDVLVEPGENINCRLCGHNMDRHYSLTQSCSNLPHFQPFWSDTFQIPVRDRYDLRELKDLREKKGLVCIGHRHAKPDPKAIRRNYENDKLTESALRKDK